jgi:NIPSNAP
MRRAVARQAARLQAPVAIGQPRPKVQSDDADEQRDLQTGAIGRHIECELGDDQRRHQPEQRAVHTALSSWAVLIKYPGRWRAARGRKALARAYHPASIKEGKVEGQQPALVNLIMPRWCHIWAYKDAAEPFAVRERARNEGVWPPPGGQPGVTLKQENMLVVPASFSPLH